MPIPILGKVSMHRGNVLSRKHNNRTFDKDKWNKDGHIDYSRTHLNDNVIDYDLAQYIDEIMGDAILENDDKNWIKHPERVIGMSKDEYEKTLQKMTEKYGDKGKEAADHIRRDRAVKNYLKKEQAKSDWIPCEITFRLGDHDNYIEMIDRVSAALSDKEIAKSGLSKEQLVHTKVDNFYKGYYQQLIKKFETDNPTLRVFGAYIHMDETVNGCPELHLDYIPVTEQKRGQRVKINNAGAFKELGYPDNGFASQITAWTADYRKKVEEFAQQYCEQQFKDMWFILPAEKCDRPHKSHHQHNAEQTHKKSVKEHLEQIFNLFKNGSKKQQEEAAQYIVDNFETLKAIANDEGQKALERAHKIDVYNSIRSQEIDSRQRSLAVKDRQLSDKQQSLNDKENLLTKREKRIEYWQSVERPVEVRTEAVNLLKQLGYDTSDVFNAVEQMQINTHDLSINKGVER